MQGPHYGLYVRASALFPYPKILQDFAQSLSNKDPNKRKPTSLHRVVLGSGFPKNWGAPFAREAKDDQII